MINFLKYFKRSMLRKNIYVLSQRFISCGVLKNRGFIEISGNSTKKYLQGLCTNDINKLEKNGDTLAAAFLNPKGRILFDGLFYNLGKMENGDDRILIETYSNQLDALLKHLLFFKLRSKVTIKPVAMTCIVNSANFNWDQHINDINGIIYEEIAKQSVLFNISDPRICNSSGRSFVSRSIIEGSFDSFLRKISIDSLSSNDIENDSLCLPIYSHSAENSLNKCRRWYDSHRILHGIAEGEELVGRIPLECNLDMLHYIDFQKGCYVGQELTARTKYQGLVRKRIVPFVVDPVLIGGGDVKQQHNQFPFINGAVEHMIVDTAVSGADSNISIMDGDVVMGYKRSTGSDGNKHVDKVGEVVSFVKDVDLGLAMLRLESLSVPEQEFSVVEGVEENKTNDAALQSKGSVYPFRPNWWPNDDPITHMPFIQA